MTERQISDYLNGLAYCNTCDKTQNRSDFKYSCRYCIHIYYCSDECKDDKKFLAHIDEEMASVKSLMADLRDDANTLANAIDAMLINDDSYDPLHSPGISEDEEGWETTIEFDSEELPDVPVTYKGPIEISSTGPWRNVNIGYTPELFRPSYEDKHVYNNTVYRIADAITNACNCIHGLFINDEEIQYIMIHPRRMTDLFEGLKQLSSTPTPHFKHFTKMLSFTRVVRDIDEKTRDRTIVLTKFYNKRTQYILHFRLPMSRIACKRLNMPAGTCMEKDVVVTTPCWGTWDEDTHNYFPDKVQESVEDILAVHDTFPTSSLGKLPEGVIREVLSRLTLLYDPNDGENHKKCKVKIIKH